MLVLPAQRIVCRLVCPVTEDDLTKRGGEIINHEAAATILSPIT